MSATVACAKLGTLARVLRPAVAASLAGTLLLAGCCPPDMDSTEPIAAARPQQKKLPRLAARPDPALLKPQTGPNCEDRSVRPAAVDKANEPSAEATRRVASNDAARTPAEGPAPSELAQQPAGGVEPAKANAEMAARIKLEYERECYRQAEARVRDQLSRLQVSVSDSLKLYKRLEAEYR